jgi:thioredoxin 1
MLELLFFTGTYCPACKAMYPIVESIKSIYPHIVSVSYIDVTLDKEKVLAYGITSIPTILLIKDNQITTRLIGPQVKSKILQLIEQNKV